MPRRSGWVWGGRIAAVAALAGLGVYLASVGLDRADKLASVLGLLVAVIALVAPYVLPTSLGDHSGSGSVQQVTNTAVGGHLTQVRDAKGVHVNGPAVSGLPKAPSPAPTPVPEKIGGQFVNGAWVGGKLTQVDGTDGDITIG